MITPTTRPKRLPRVLAAAAVALTTTVVFAALGGVGLAETSVSAAQYQYGQKVTLCHKPGTPAEHTITVAAAAVPAHKAHGDTVGTCARAHAKAKAAKAKAAKAKAAKTKAAKAKAAKATAAKAEAAKAKAAKAEGPKEKGHGKGKEAAPTPTTAPSDHGSDGKGKGKGRGK